MTPPDLSRLSPQEKDALILALLERVAALEAKLNQPPKAPSNSSLPPSRGQKANRPLRSKKPRRKRKGPGVTRALSADLDHVVDCHAHACAHCGTAVTAETQRLRHAYDHIDLPPIRPVITRVRLSECRPACDRNTGRFGVGNRGRFQSESATLAHKSAGDWLQQDSEVGKRPR